MDPLAETALSDHPEPADELKRGAQLGRYVVLGKLGAGGMGVVYAAYDPELDRKVAIKLLRGAASAEARDRLLREAQAMARLAHPNVIGVHDVGTFEDRVFVTLEFVEGRTLGAWLRERERGWREILQAFVMAGRGLAAAHAAGLVHRDFKPETTFFPANNCRILVGDFGLAHAVGARVEAAPVKAQSGRPLETPLTRTGAFMGTPGYMSPEQMLGKPTDARSDQFSFCVALYEALFRQRPFAGDNVADLAYEVMQGNLRVPPTGSDVPPWLRRAIVRGLANKADERHASMDALLVELARDPAASRRRVIGVVAAIVVIVSATAIAWRNPQGGICGGGDARMAEVWNPARRAQIQAAFRKTGLPYADSTFERAAQTLDGFASRWARMHREACEATRVRGDQSAELLDLRMECLERRRHELRSLGELWSSADAPAVSNAVSAAQSLELADCADAQALRAPVRPPSAEVREKLPALQRSLAEARALGVAGRYAAAATAAEPIAEAAVALHYRPLEAEALALRGTYQDRAGDAKSAERSLRDAVVAAEAGRHDRAALEAWVQLVGVVGYSAGRFAEGHECARLARALLSRLPSDRLEADLSVAEARVFDAEQKYGDAQTLLQHALALRERAFGPESAEVAGALNGIARVHIDGGDAAPAIAPLERAIAIQRKIFGDQHPEVARALNNLGSAYEDLGRHADALVQFQRAHEIWERALGPEHRDLTMVLNNEGMALEGLGRHREAQASLERALAIAEKGWGSEHPRVAATLSTLGDVLAAAGQRDAAAQAYQRCITIREKAFGPNHPAVKEARESLAKLRKRG